MEMVQRFERVEPGPGIFDVCPWQDDDPFGKRWMQHGTQYGEIKRRMSAWASTPCDQQRHLDLAFVEAAVVANHPLVHPAGQEHVVTIGDQGS